MRLCHLTLGAGGLTLEGNPRSARITRNPVQLKTLIDLGMTVDRSGQRPDGWLAKRPAGLFLGELTSYGRLLGRRFSCGKPWSFSEAAPPGCSKLRPGEAHAVLTSGTSYKKAKHNYVISITLYQFEGCSDSDGASNMKKEETRREEKKPYEEQQRI